MCGYDGYSDLSTDYLSVMLWLLIIGPVPPTLSILTDQRAIFPKIIGQMLPYAGGRGASGGSVLAS